MRTCVAADVRACSSHTACRRSATAIRSWCSTEAEWWSEARTKSSSHSMACIGSSCRMSETGTAAPGAPAAGDGFLGWVLANGSTRHVGANRPFELSDDRAWFVRAGVLDLFLQPTHGTLVGRRHLLCTAPTGALVWSGDEWALPPDWRLVAVGHAGTEVVELGAGHLSDWPDDVSRRVEQFVELATTNRVDGPVARSDGSADAAPTVRAVPRTRAIHDAGP